MESYGRRKRLFFSFATDKNKHTSKRFVKLCPLFSVTVIVGSLHVPQSSGRRRITQINGPCNSIHKKTSMVMIVNEDALCMARVIGVCYAKISIVSDEEWSKIDVRKGSLDILIGRGQTSKAIYKNICKKDRGDQKKLSNGKCVRGQSSISS